MLRSRRTHALAVLALLARRCSCSGIARSRFRTPKTRCGSVLSGSPRVERALVNIYAIGNPNEIGNPNDTPWDFRRAGVRPARRSSSRSRRLQLARGVIGSVELLVQDEENTTATRLSRRTFRAEIVGFNPQPDPPGKWAVTLEVIDRLTGRTSLLLGGPDTLPAAPVGTPGLN